MQRMCAEVCFQKLAGNVGNNQEPKDLLPSMRLRFNANEATNSRAQIPIGIDSAMVVFSAIVANANFSNDALAFKKHVPKNKPPDMAATRSVYRALNVCPQPRRYGPNVHRPHRPHGPSEHPRRRQREPELPRRQR